MSFYGSLSRFAAHWDDMTSEMDYSKSLGWLAVTLLPVLSVIAQAPNDIPQGVCRRYGHQTGVIDRKLYIDGCYLYADPISDNPAPTMSEDIIYSDLNDTYEGMPRQHKGLGKNSSVPSVAGGTLWADDVNKILWLYGGEYSSAPRRFELWGYDTRRDQWNKSDAATRAISSIPRVAYGAGANIGGTGYYYGGYLNSNTNPSWSGAAEATSNLISYDMDNDILRSNIGYDSIGRAEGVLLAIPASAAGLLIYFGGVTLPYGNSTEVAMSMDTILLYDIGDGRWYSQTATGNIPANRRKFCAGVTWADDQSSYNAYLYGGLGFGENSTGFDDVYILSMPTFEWIKWYPTEAGQAYPKGLLTCNIIDRGQMMVIGGNYTNSSDACDVPKIGGQHNLNLGQLNVNSAKWYQYLPNLTDYSVPADILSATGGTSDGGAANSMPANGWGDRALSVYFGQKAMFPTRIPRYYPSTASAAPTAKSNTAAIAGGAAGGGVALIIVALLFWWCCVKKRKSAAGNQVQDAQPQIQATPNELNADPNRYSRDVFAQALGSPNTHAYNTSYHSPSSSPPPQHYHPTQMLQQGYGPLDSYPQQFYQQTSGHPAPGQIHAPHPQVYYPPPPQSQKVMPPTEMAVRGMTPGTYHVQHSTQRRSNPFTIDSVSNRSGGDMRLDSRSQSTHSPTNSTWKG